MISNNNMVAVRAAIDALKVRPVHDGYDDRGNYIWDDAVSLKEVHAVLTRLASPQPDAQPGEGRDMDVSHEMVAGGFGHGVSHCKHCKATEREIAFALGPVCSVARLATPSSPALDAATIERCAQVVEGSWVLGSHQKERVAAAIRALPNAEKRHG